MSEIKLRKEDIEDLKEAFALFSIEERREINSNDLGKIMRSILECY